MARQYKFFTIPVKGGGEAEKELNGFLSTARAPHIHRELLPDGESSFWCMAVEYDSASNKAYTKSFGKRIDYREVLSPEDFAIFTQLRDWRKETAKRENVKAYVIFTDAQIGKISEKRPDTQAGLLDIEGIGKSRAEKYGRVICGIWMILSCLESAKMM